MNWLRSLAVSAFVVLVIAGCADQTVHPYPYQSVLRISSATCGQVVTNTGYVAFDDVVVTASHSVFRSEWAQATTWDGHVLHLEPVGHSAKHDLAVFRVVSGPTPPPMEHADAVIEELAWLLSHHEGQARHQTWGYVGVENVSIPGWEIPLTVLDMHVALGASGAPVLNHGGEAIGVLVGGVDLETENGPWPVTFIVPSDVVIETVENGDLEPFDVC